MRFGLFQSLLLAAATVADPHPLVQAVDISQQTETPVATTTPATPPVAGALPSVEIRSRAQRRVFQLATQVAEGSEKQSYGTAFVIDRAGYLITNFHVVSSAALNPKKYKLLLHVGTEALPATLIQFDVMNDLALVQVPRTFEQAYTISRQPAAMGEKVFLIGVPEDTVMTLIEGNFSDSKWMGPVARLIASAPLNHGMSGGPVVNNRDELVGVNDAILEKAQNLSFLIPVDFVAPLARARENKARAPASVDTAKEIQRQVSAGLSPWITRWADIERASQSFKLGSFKIAQPPENSRCWEDVKNVRSRELRVHLCQGSDGFSVTNENRGGALLLQYFVLDKGGSALTDSRKSILEGAALEFQKSTRSREGYLGKYSCSNRYLKNISGVSLLAEYCVTPVKEVQALADAIVTVSTLDGASRLVGTMTLRGFPKAELLNAASIFINGISIEGAK